jgi:hypothetical protein
MRRAPPPHTPLGRCGVAARHPPSPVFPSYPHPNVPLLLLLASRRQYSVSTNLTYRDRTIKHMGMVLLRRAALLGLSVLAFAHVARAFAVTRLSARLAPSRVSLLCARATARLRLRGVTRAMSLRAAAELTPDMSDVLKRYGVPAADHAALVAELAPLLVGKKASAARVETLEVTLQRGPEGGLSLRVPMCLSPSCTASFCLSLTLALSVMSHCVSVSLSCFSLPVFLSPLLSLTHSTILSLTHCLAISVYFFLSPFHLSPLFLSLALSLSLSLSLSFSLFLALRLLSRPPSLPPCLSLFLSGLGIDVDKSNIIQGNKGQRGLQVGDRVVAIDGVRLGSKFVAQALFSKVRSIVASSK